MKFVLSVLGARSLTLALLGVILAACVMATFLPLPSALERIYHSAWFLGLLAAFGLHTLACIANELFERKLPLGFFLIHVGSVVLLAGGAIGYRGFVSGMAWVPVGEGVSAFEIPWKGEDVLVSRSGAESRGRFLGIQVNRLPGPTPKAPPRQVAEVLFTPRGGRPVWIPLDDVDRLQVDPDRPGRRVEQDQVERSGGDLETGFITAISQDSVHWDVDGKAATFPRSELRFLRMGHPSLIPLGFTLRLDDFRIQEYPGTGMARLLLRGPAGDEAQIEPEPGAQAELEGGVRVTVTRYFSDAVVDPKKQTIAARSKLTANPAAEIEISWEGGKETRHVFEHRMPGFHRRGRSGVDALLMVRPGMVKRYESDVAILEEGALARKATIIVNGPLTYGGWTFYQSDYNPRVFPVRSGFQVVNDPGLEIVYAGFVLLLLGLVEVCYFRPFRASRRRAAASETGVTTNPDVESAPGTEAS